MAYLIGSILSLYSWVVIGALIVFLFLIGRFYEHKFRRRSYYQLFLLPLVLLTVGAVWYAIMAFTTWRSSPQDFVGIVGADLLFLTGGLVLVGLGSFLYRLMMARKG